MRSPRAVLFAFAIMASSLASAANVDSVYYPEQAKLVLPNLKIGNRIYYVILKQLPNSYDFRLDSPSITDLSVPLTFTPAATADLYGTFSPADDPTLSVTFKSDGTYSNVDGPDPLCPAGGESGTWQYEPATGVLTAVALTIGNGDCGISHSNGITRVKKSGTTLFLLKTKDGTPRETAMVRKS